LRNFIEEMDKPDEMMKKPGEAMEKPDEIMEKPESEMRTPKLKILVCYYQPWKQEIPKDSIFLPIQAGKANSSFDLNMLDDSTGDNISDRNEMFGEFTAWYWGWKNIKKHYPEIEYVGLSHYRRFFAMPERGRERVIDLAKTPIMNDYEKRFIKSLEKHDIILAKPEYFPYSLRVDFSFWHNSFDYICLEEIVHEMCPEYYESFVHVWERNSKMSLYCMFVAKYDLFDKYFNWLFPLLFEAERRIDVSKYPKYQKRVLAFLAERMLNVFVYHHKLRIDYKPIYFIHAPEENYKEKSNIILKMLSYIKPPNSIVRYYPFNMLLYKFKKSLSLVE
jgi:hypothetical protein